MQERRKLNAVRVYLENIFLFTMFVWVVKNA